MFIFGHLAGFTSITWYTLSSSASLLNNNFQSEVFLQSKIGSAVGKGIAIFFSSDIKGCSHAKTGILVPFLSNRGDTLQPSRFFSP